MFLFKSDSYERTIIELRAVARRLGLTSHLSRARSIFYRLKGADSYEVHFDRALMEKIRPGDVVWDVGANVGFYTTQLSDAVGSSGRVVAFEPFPSCFAELQRRTAGRTNVAAVQTALGAEAGLAPLSVGDDPLSAVNKLFPGPGTKTVNVAVARGDELVATQQVPSPNVVKIDVEGFEEEVIQGFGALLAAPGCRAILCEMHFAILDQRGRRQAPARITRLLRESGFVVRWVDASHLEAVRLAHAEC